MTRAEAVVGLFNVGLRPTGANKSRLIDSRSHKAFQDLKSGRRIFTNQS